MIFVHLLLSCFCFWLLFQIIVICCSCLSLLSFFIFSVFLTDFVFVLDVRFSLVFEIYESNCFAVRYFQFLFFVFSFEPLLCHTFVGVNSFSAVNSRGVHQTQNITHQTQNITHRQSNSKANAASEDQTHDREIMGPRRCQLRYRRLNVNEAKQKRSPAASKRGEARCI